jgi:hypothetical protein
MRERQRSQLVHAEMHSELSDDQRKEKEIAAPYRLVDVACDDPASVGKGEGHLTHSMKITARSVKDLRNALSFSSEAGAPQTDNAVALRLEETSGRS